MIDKNRIYENMKQLIEVPSISGTDDEIKAAYKLEELLKEIPYFAEHPEAVELVPLFNDPFERKIVTALLPATTDSRSTVILTGHYDVVDVEEFGALKEEAFRVEEISAHMEQLSLDASARKDFDSGEWLWGRGTADMKFGHAMCLELLRYYSEQETRNGNLLYVAVCGEETNSEGMLRAVPFFNQLAEEKGLEYTALLLTECYDSEGKEDDHLHYVHMGASGKIMPMFFFVGESTHGDAPFLGLDPNLLAAEVYTRMQMNVDFCQEALGEVTPPPVCLKSQDLKSTYSVSIPLYAASYYNIISVNMDPEGTMEKIKAIAEESFQAAIGLLAQRAEDYEAKFGKKPSRHAYEPLVLTFRELCEIARKAWKGEESFDDYIREQIRAMQKEKLEMQTIAVYAVRRIVEIAGLSRPMIVISVIPPVYPDIFPDKEEPKAKALLAHVAEVIKDAEAEYGEHLQMKDYYMGLSDLSYTGLAPDKNFDGLFENVVGVDQMYSLPVTDLKKFYVPSIVLGGYGKDFHKHTERLHKHYNFDVLPHLYTDLIDRIFGQRKD